MEFGDCYSSVITSLCKKLLNSLANFQVYSQERKIRLVFTPPINTTVSLNLTVLHGPCEISCEGDPNSCNVTREDRFWPDTSYPFYIENCTRSHNYCVMASIGECCPICTNSVFVEDYKKEYSYEDGWRWSTNMAIVILFTLIIFSICFVAVLKDSFIGGLRSSRRKSQNVIEDHLTQSILKDENKQHRIQLLCLYLKEQNPLFLDMVNSLKEFLSRKGIHVIDIHDEEENINCSVTKWVKNIINEERAKVLLCDSENIQQLWNGTMDRDKILTPLEQAIHFARSCVPVNNVHKYLFVVRFEETDIDSKRFVDLSDGRCYVYPIHSERLASDIKS